MESVNQERETEVPAESGSNPAKLELWKKAPSDFLAEAVARSSDDTRAEVARNMRDMLEEKEPAEEKNTGLKTRTREEITVWLTTSQFEELKERASERGITPSKLALMLLEASSQTDQVKEDSQTKNWQKTSVFIHEEIKQDLQDAAEEKDIDLEKEASIRLQESLSGEGK